MQAEDYQKQTFDSRQLEVIIKGVNKGFNIAVYANPAFLAIQMEEIYEGMEAGVDVSAYASLRYDWFQMEQIRKGLENQVDISKYADPAIPFDKMRQIRLGLENGLDLSPFKNYTAGVLEQIRKAYQEKVNISEYIVAGYSASQLEEIRCALKHKVDLKPYIVPEMRSEAMHEIRLGLEIGVKVDVYAQIDYSWQQMREIRFGLESRVDIEQYCNVLYVWRQMREIRKGIEKGLDVTGYRSLMYTAVDMRRMRKQLEWEDKASAEAPDAEAIQQSIEEAGIPLKKQEEDYSDCLVSVDETGMNAYIYIHGDTRMEYTGEILLTQLKKEGVVYGVDMETLEQIAEEHIYDKAVLVATGKAGVHGADGYYEFMFRTDIPQIPKILADGTVDYLNTQYFEQIERGQVVAVYHPATWGHAGQNVLGKFLPGIKGMEQKMLHGRNIKVLEDNMTYIATENGRIEYQNNSIIISPLYVVEKVNRASGNILFNGNVYVRGNVSGGVTIRATGEIVIEGNVENAQIAAQKQIVVKGGATGGGNTVISSADSIYGTFFENVVLQAGKNVNANYCMNCSIIAGDSVIISGSRGALIGGSVKALKNIESYQIGNKAEVCTNISMGVSEDIIQRSKKAEERIKKITIDLEVFYDAYKKMQMKYAPEERNVMEVYLKIEQGIEIKEAELKKELEAKSRIDAIMEVALRCELKVKGTLHVGTILRMNHEMILVKYDLRNISARMLNNKIAVYALR